MIDSITKLREQKGGNLKGMNLQEIVSQACNILEQQTRSSKVRDFPFLNEFCSRRHFQILFLLQTQHCLINVMHANH